MAKVGLHVPNVHFPVYITILRLSLCSGSHSFFFVSAPTSSTPISCFVQDVLTSFSLSLFLSSFVRSFFILGTYFSVFGRIISFSYNASLFA